MRTFTSLLAAGIFSSIVSSGWADATNVSFDSGSHLLYTTAAQTTPLSQGVAATLGDGAMLQLGYYSQATVATPFAGTFITLAGVGGSNTFPTYGGKITIGDDPANGAGAGQFALSLTFTAGSTTTGNNLPAANTPLTIRFFNNTTTANSNLFNAVNAPTWLWQTPATPTAGVALSLDDAGIRFQDGSTNHFYTDLAVVPEASTCAYVFIGLAALIISQRRKASV